MEAPVCIVWGVIGRAIFHTHVSGNVTRDRNMSTNMLPCQTPSNASGCPGGMSDIPVKSSRESANRALVIVL